MTVSANDQTEYSNIENLLKNDLKEAYAICSNDFTTVDGSVLFLPGNPKDYKKNTGYVSNSIADAEGLFDQASKIEITLEAIYGHFSG